MATSSTAVPRASLRIYKGKGKGTGNAWRWSFSVNGRIMADSSEGYAQKQTARRAWRKFYTRVVGAKFAIHEDGVTGANPRLTKVVTATAKKTVKKVARRKGARKK